MCALGSSLAFGVLCHAAPAEAAGERVSIFYYPWWSNPTHDGAYRHWQQRGHRPPDDLASEFYPVRGAYSSGDPALLRAQMAEISRAGIDEVVVSWWGAGSLEDDRLPAIQAAARRAGLRVAAHVEPYAGRTADTVGADIRSLRARGIVSFYVYLPGDIPDADWAKVNDTSPGVRVLAQTGKVGRAVAGHFDGIYTYDILAFGGRSFRRLCEQAHRARLLCLPSVGPGYRAARATGDRRVKPRLDGATYDSMWWAAIRAHADGITITSYNEWHEGTQVEPARTLRSRKGFRYLGYAGAWGRQGTRARCAYLDRTAQWVRALRARPPRTIFGQPLTTPSGTSCATRLARPARSTTSTTRSTSLYANGASSASPLFDGERTTMPRSSSWRRSSAPPICFRAPVRLISRPAPWHVVPKARSIEPGSPARTKLDVPMLPGMKTGWPTSRYRAGISPEPAGKARVAPLRWTQTVRPPWLSTLATLCATS